MTLDTQLFHLPLDQISNNSIANIGGLSAGAIAHGNPVIQIDPEMGACLKFDGIDDYIELTQLDNFDFKDGMSFTAWVRFDKTRYYYDILNFSTAQGNNSSYFRIGADEGQDIQFKSDHYEFTSSSDPSLINIGAWCHIALVYDYLQRVTIFIDGQNIGYLDEYDKIASMSWSSAFLGKTNGNHGALFYGAMANVRIYNCAITAETLNTVMSEDKVRNLDTIIKVTVEEDTNDIGNFSGISPLKVDLYTVRDNEHLPILYIESDNKSEPLELKLTNTGINPIQFGPVNTLGEFDFQVQLCFRRKVISPNLLTKLQTANTKEIGDWQYAIGISGDQTYDFISLAKKLGDFSLESRKKLSIQIPGFSASADAGARNTRVEVRYKNSVQNPGSVIRQMEIQNHIGLKTVPLIARVKGSNTLLNNGTEPNELTLEIACTKLGGTVQLSNQTRFTLIVDDELFGSMSKDIHATTEMQGLNAQTKNEGLERTSFAFEVQNENLRIETGSSILIQVSNFISDAPNGAYNLLLQYEGIPGYWDGAWTIPVEFDPWVIREGNVGIGTDHPAATLHVKGTINLESEHGSFNTTQPESDFDFLQNDSSTQRAVTIHGGQQGGNVLEVWSKDDQQQNVPGFSVSNKTGHVGVGTVEPQQALHVEGSTYLNGNVGIGTDHPDQKLVVNGRIKDQTGFLMPVGAIIAFGGQVAPEGWLLCDGQTVLTDTEHSELKIVLGAGHNDKTPDLRSRFIVGAGQGDGKDDRQEPLKNYKHYDTGGEQNHTLITEEMPPHSHTIHVFKANFNHEGDATETSLTDDGDGDYGELSTSSAGGEGSQARPHNNLPPYYALTYIIKY